MSTGNNRKIIPESLSTKQLIDSGSALVLILLITGFFTEIELFYKAAIPVLLLNMIFPKIFYPFALFWYTLSNALGYVMSRILFSIIYVLMVMPVGLLRRLFGKDSLNLHKFKKDRSSVMRQRDYTFSSKDISHPY